MPSHNTYRLTWVSLTLDVGYLFTAAPAKCSRCSLPWTRGISSPPPLLTLTWNSSSRASCTRAATARWTWGCSSRPPPLASGGPLQRGTEHWRLRRRTERGREELPHVRGQGQKPGGPHARGAAAKRSYPASEVRGGG